MVERGGNQFHLVWLRTIHCHQYRHPSQGYFVRNDASVDKDRVWPFDYCESYETALA
jgi:hypothetical protein